MPVQAILRRALAAFAYRDFRVLWFGAFTSTIGTWMQKVAQSWLVLTISGSSSAFFLGLDSFLGELPILLFTLIGGVVADMGQKSRVRGGLMIGAIAAAAIGVPASLFPIMPGVASFAFAIGTLMLAGSVTATSAQLCYRPPYSPDLNPIENAVAKLKTLIRSAAERTIDGLQQQIENALNAFSKTECANYFRHAGYASI